MPPSGKKNHKITVVTFALMIAVALFYDVAQAEVNLLHTVPFVGNTIAWLGTTIIDLYAFLTFFVWFKVKGVSFANPKRGLTMAGATLVELIPVLNTVPAWTLAVIICFITTRAEETLAETIEKVGAAAGAAGAVAGAASKIPLLSKGAREGLGAVSEGAKKISAGAKEAASDVRSLSSKDQAGFDKATRRKDTGAVASTAGLPEKQLAGRTAAAAQQDAGGRDTGVKQPPTASPKAAPPPDIGAQPVFRQGPQEAPEPQQPLSAASQTPPSAPAGTEGAPAAGPAGQGGPQAAPAEAASKAQAAQQPSGTPTAQKKEPERAPESGKPQRPQAPSPLPETKGPAPHGAAATDRATSAEGEPRSESVAPEQAPESRKGVTGGEERRSGPQPSPRSPSAPSGPAASSGGGSSPRGGYSRFRKPADFAGLRTQAEEYMQNRAEFVRKQAAEKLKAQGLGVAEKIRRGEKLGPAEIRGIRAENDDTPDDSVSLAA